jgi:N-acetylmuramic acid 6-phosphate (MurNAc-6-P) etherase
LNDGARVTSPVLQLLDLTPSPQSVDYVENKHQFHLFDLLTEQRHPRTWNLSFVIQSDVTAGLRMLLSVDEDVLRKVTELAQNPAPLEQAVDAVVEAIRSHHKIYFYGCGATGRLAKQMESSFWRPFWARVRAHQCWEKLKAHLPDDIGERCIGEMTGADRALVSSLEGFEDLQLIGRLQLQDRGVERGDVVICVTEGGETSSVIGTALGALDQYGSMTERKKQEASRHIYFVYNNPDDVLRPLERCVSVLDNAAITKINLVTGPQAITGSTRMQATTIATFVLGVVLEEAIAGILEEHLTSEELRTLGYDGHSSLTERLKDFAGVKDAVDTALPMMARFTTIETDTYRQGRYATYFAKKALITVFIDNTERSPTFRLYPLDRVEDKERKCWLQVWTEADNLKDAWRGFLGRPFRGLEPHFYKEAFERQVTDPYLREAALRSLVNAGNDQELSYDFSFSGFNIERKGPAPGDLGVAVLVDEELEDLAKNGSGFQRFTALCRERGANIALLFVTGCDGTQPGEIASRLNGINGVTIPVIMPSKSDPLTVRRQIALKMLLNAHSTGIMAALGRVVGNTMTNVSPSNLKLIGRATYLVLSHVNDTIMSPQWPLESRPAAPVRFSEASAVLFDAMDYVRDRDMGQTAEVSLSIIRILEALRRREPVSWDEAGGILAGEGLAAYLFRLNRSLGACP